MSLWDRLDEDRRNRMLDGDTAMAWLRKHESIERWQEVGQSASDLQAVAMELAGTNGPTGAGYNRAWRELAEHVPHIRDLDSSTRTHAMWMASNWEAVDKWRHTLAVNVRLRLNHPSAVKRRYDATHEPLEQNGDDKKKKENKRRNLQDQITKLIEELDATRKVKTTGAMPPNMPAEDFASMLAEQMSQTTRRRFFEAFRKAMDNEDRQDRIEAGHKARK